MGYNSLEGIIPPEISLLSNLQSLLVLSIFIRYYSIIFILLIYFERFLSANNLTGIPAQISFLSNLESLLVNLYSQFCKTYSSISRYLNNNNLTAMIPFEISGLTNLRELYVESHNLNFILILVLDYYITTSLQGKYPPKYHHY